MTQIPGNGSIRELCRVKTKQCWVDMTSNGAEGAVQLTLKEQPSGRAVATGMAQRQFQRCLMGTGKGSSFCHQTQGAFGIGRKRQGPVSTGGPRGL